MSKRAVIIGGGMAGLSAGCYLQMNGIQTTILEMNATPGGVCTSWDRGDYTVDLCVHWLVGSGSNNSFYDRWNELIDLDDIQFVDHEEFLCVANGFGKFLHIYTDVDRLHQELMLQAPEDEAEIRHFINGIRRLTQLELHSEKAYELANVWDKMKSFYKVLPYMDIFAKFGSISARDYARRFKNPMLRKAIEYLFEPDTSILFSMLTLAWMHNKSAGYPIGGSLRFASRIYERFLELDGQMYFRAKAKKILVKDGHAFGVETESGEKFFGDYIISAADGHQTIYQFLDGKYTDDRILHAFEHLKTFPSLIFIALGVGRDFSDHPPQYVFPLHRPIDVDPTTRLDDLMVHFHHYDPTLAPEGKSLVSLMIDTYNYSYWQHLYETDKEQYEEEKRRVAAEVIDAIEDRLGDFREFVEVVDVSTPVTFIQYTNNWKGSFEGWQMTPETGFRNLPHRLPGLSNFFMCGHWVALGGGLPSVMLSGREVAQIICQEDGKAFVVRPPNPAAKN